MINIAKFSTESINGNYYNEQDGLNTLALMINKEIDSDDIIAMSVSIQYDKNVPQYFKAIGIVTHKI